MLNLRRQEKEAEPGLSAWLVSPKPVEQQYAAECLAEMGDTHGTDFLILLASTEHGKRRRSYYWQSAYIVLGSWLAFCAVSFALNSSLTFNGIVLGLILGLTRKSMKASRLQQTAVGKLAEGRNPAAVGALVDALWKAEPTFREAAVQGLVRLLPRAGKDLRLSERQWNLLLNQIRPPSILHQNQAPRVDFVVAVLKAIAAAEYFPAIDRAYSLSVTPPSLWVDSIIRSVASDCYAHLKQRRSEKARVLQPYSSGSKP